MLGDCGRSGARLPLPITAMRGYDAEGEIVRVVDCNRPGIRADEATNRDVATGSWQLATRYRY
jgi:hypothetical protein